MQTKSPKTIQMILLTLLIVIVGEIIVGALSNNNSIAYSEEEVCSVCHMPTLKWTYNPEVHGYYCDYCQDWDSADLHNSNPVNYLKTEIYMSHITYYSCRDCHYTTEKTEQCNLINFQKVDENTHKAQCKGCRDIYILPHVDTNKNGKCDDCSATVAQNTPDNHICLDNSEYEIVVFDYAYHDYYAICNLCENPIPDWQKREAHDFGKTTSKGSIGHGATCKICGYESIQEHEGANHETGGKCTVCDYRYQTHKQSTTIEEYKITETGHTPIYACTHGGCTATYVGTETKHNYRNGICTTCGQAEPQEEVKLEIKSEKYKLDETYISNVQPKTKVSDFKANIETNGTHINIYNTNNQLINDSTKIGTGTKIEIKTESETKTFTIIVNGDVTGDGEADFIDIVKINQARLNKEELDDINFLAADVTKDGKIDFVDIVKINRIRLNKITEL